MWLDVLDRSPSKDPLEFCFKCLSVLSYKFDVTFFCVIYKVRLLQKFATFQGEPTSSQSPPRSTAMFVLEFVCSDRL